MASAMRSALARLGSRACITAPSRMPPLRPAAVRNVEGLQCYSNQSFVMANKKKGNSEMFMSTWSKRSRKTLKTVLETDRYLYALSASGVAIYSAHMLTKFLRREFPSRSRIRLPDVNYYDDDDDDYCMDDGKDED